MATVNEQAAGGQLRLGEIDSPELLDDNLAANAVPSNLASVTVDSYRDFLMDRRKLMAAYIREYYWSL